MPVARRRSIAVVLAVVALATAAPAATGLGGREIYEQACASCHGPDGRGRPEGSRIEVPLPDFTDCGFVTAESTANWAKLVTRGGAALGLSAQMPAFGAALEPDEIRAVLGYVRAFCTDPAWPLGDLNYRRLQVVTKAFPEDEVVLTLAHSGARHANETELELEIEKRIGARGQLELGLPLAVLDVAGRAPIAGVGDVGIAYAHVLTASATTGTIVSAGADVALPTGNRRHGVGGGTVVVAPRVLAGQRLLGPVVAQAEVRADLPADRERAPRQMVYVLGVGVPLAASRRAVVPALELEQTHALASDEPKRTLLTPQVYLPLSRSGHVAVSVGATVPVAGERPFDWQARAFLIWDYADGPFWAW